MSERNDAVSAAWVARKALENLQSAYFVNGDLATVRLEFDLFCERVFTEDELAAIRDETEAVAA